jgi:hypothetical protein
MAVAALSVFAVPAPTSNLKARFKVTQLGRRLLAFTKTLVGLAAITVVLSTAVICILQALVWVKTGMWGSLRASQILELAGLEVDRTYVASGASQAQSPVFDSFIEWWLDAPAIIPLFVATAFFGTVYMWLKSLAEAPR